MKINVGCGHYPLEGYLNIDAHTDEADVRADFWELRYAGAEEVRAEHILEHLPWRMTRSALRRWSDWLAPGGRLIVEVPDMGVIAPGDPDWVRYIYGSQDHPGEFHQAGFMAHTLMEAVAGIGLADVGVAAFRSTRPMRIGMPCLLATATKAA